MKPAYCSMKLCSILLYILNGVVGDPSFYDNSLNVPQLLLPYAASGLEPTSFLLRALKGCFKWTSTKPHVASIAAMISTSNGTHVEIEDENACSQFALVKVTLKNRKEHTSVILAEEESTGTTLRCDVFVDAIDHISIATTARELLIGESPEVFEIHAYDKEGNTFSSLGSTTFEWNIKPVITPVGPVEQRSVLKMLWFHDSVYETTAEIYQLESKESRGHSVLIEGVSTGDAFVSAKVAHPEYDNVESEVKVTVLDNVILIPPNEYILQHQVVPYSAYQLRRGKQKKIVLPSEQYSLKVVSGEIGELNEIDVTVKGLSNGSTNVLLVDKNMANLSSVRMPSATINVVDPAKIGFALNPGKIWILEVGRIYHIHVLLFDADNNRITIEYGVMFSSVLLEEYFDIHFKANNGSYFLCKAKNVGKTVIQSTLQGVEYGDDMKVANTPVFGEQNMEIFDPIMVTPEHLVFPWDPSLVGPESYQYQLTASGGSGNYLWSSLNPSITAVNKIGIVSGGSVVGTANVKVFDMKNQNHNALSKITVLKATSMFFVDGKVECLVGDVLMLSLSLSAEVESSQNVSLFKDCRKMKLVLSFSETAIFKEMPPHQDIPDEGCTSILLQGLNVGHTTLTVTYTYADITLMASIVIAAFEHVRVVDPFEFSVVTLGSTKRIVAEAGPSPWVLDSSQYFHVMSAEEDNWVRINSVRLSGDSVMWRSEHVFDVACHKLGEQVLTILVFNKPTLKNKFPAESSTTTRFVCSPPAAMKLVPLINLPEIDGTKRTLESCIDGHKRIPVLNNRELRINLFVYDSSGNLFDDASSLNISWSSDDSSAAEFLTPDLKSSPKNADTNTRSNRGVQLFQVVLMYSNQLPVTVKATILSYRFEDGSKEEVIEPAVSAHLPMMTISAPSIFPNYLTMAVHHLNQVTLTVTGGTKEFVLKSDGYTDLNFSPPTGLRVVAKAEGRDKVLLYDACLDANEPAEATLLLRDISMVELFTGDKVEVGKTIDCNCTAFDRDGNLLAISDAALTEVDLELKTSLDIVHMKRHLLGQVTEVNYVLTGKDVGDTKLTCKGILPSGNDLLSKAKDLQVFSPIQLDPKYVLLIVGSTYQIHSRGGPRPHSATVYSCENETVLHVNSLGLVSTKNIGKTVVIGQAKRDILYSQDQTIVEVVQLKGFKISLKTRILITNTEVGILCIGITDEGPFTFASSLPNLKFFWKSSDSKVVAVDSIHYKAGVSAEIDAEFRAVIRARSPGVATIKLCVQVLSNDFSQVIEGASLEDEIQLQVFEKLQLLYPASGSLLLPVNTMVKLKTNKDQLLSVSYEVLSFCADKQENVIRVFNSGQVNALSSGTANVLVTSQEFGFNQTGLVQVEVKPVASITLVSNSLFVVTGKEHPSYPIGSTAEFGVSLHDNMARKFDVSTIPLLHALSRAEVVHIVPNAVDSIFSVLTNNLGETILKVWSKDDPSILDYVRISVAEGITPSNATVTLGDTICFVPGATEGDGSWSADGNVLSLDHQSGVAVGLSLGIATIRYHTGTYSTHADITVVPPIETPTFVNDGNLFITNAGENHLFYLLINSKTYDTSCSNQVSLVQNTGIVPFSCVAAWVEEDELTVDNIFKVEAVYVSGKPACSFTTRILTLEQERTLSASSERTLTLYAKISDIYSNNNYESVTSNIPFIPKFSLGVDSVVFEVEDTSKEIKVFGSYTDISGLSIYSDLSSLKISNIDGNIEATLDQVFNADIDSSITFYSSLTKSKFVLPVKIKGKVEEKPQVCGAEEKTEIPPPWWSNLSENSMWVLANTIAIGIIILLLVFYQFIKKKQPVKPLLVPPSPYSPHTIGQSSSYINNASNSPYSPYYNRTNIQNGTLFSVSQ